MKKIASFFATLLICAAAFIPLTLIGMLAGNQIFNDDMLIRGAKFYAFISVIISLIVAAKEK